MSSFAVISNLRLVGNESVAPFSQIGPVPDSAGTHTSTAVADALRMNAGTRPLPDAAVNSTREMPAGRPAPWILITEP